MSRLMSRPWAGSGWTFCLFLTLAVHYGPSATWAQVATETLKDDPAKKESVKADKPDAPKTVKKSVAHIQLHGDYPETAGAPGLFGDVLESLSKSLARLDKAANDEAISAVILHINSPQIGWGKLHEFRQAVARVRAKGKPVYAWMESAMLPDYLLATSCDKIILPESGVLLLVGIRAEVSFYKNLLDKLSIQPDILKMGEFKSAGEPYTRTEMSKEFREEMDVLLDDRYAQLLEMITQSRKLSADTVKGLIDNGPYTATVAHKAGLIDHLAYEDAIPALIKGDDANTEIKIVKNYGKKKVDVDFSGFNGMVNFMNLLTGVEPAARKSSAPKIAVIHATGPIMSGPSQSDLFGGETIGSDTLIKAIRQARDDATVKAVVLRIDSPGGSALASDLIWHELQTLKKPLIASMGDVAASGGYYIAMGADKIYAEPGTITGSIGVIGGKMALKGLYEKVGITTTVLQRGKNSGVLSSTNGFSDSERESMTKLLMEIYDQFTKKAATGRKMEHAQLEKLARGRIYSGVQAKKLGLVDEIGTLDEAVAAAKLAAGLKADEKVERLLLPKAVSPFEQMFGNLNETRLAEQATQATLKKHLPEEFSAHLQQFSAWERLGSEPAIMVMPCRILFK